MEKEQRSVKQQVASLLGIILGGIGLACLVVAYLVLTYGPTGRYQSANILLEPKILGDLSFIDTERGLGKEGRLVLDSIQFRYLNEKEGQWETKQLTLFEYAKIYDLLIHDISYSNKDDQNLDTKYTQNNLAILEVTVQPLLHRNTQNSPEVLQSIQFIPNTGEYRIKIRSRANHSYAYFRQPEIFKKILEVFNSQAND